MLIGCDSTAEHSLRSREGMPYLPLLAQPWGKTGLQIHTGGVHGEKRGSVTPYSTRRKSPGRVIGKREDSVGPSPSEACAQGK